MTRNLENREDLVENKDTLDEETTVCNVASGSVNNAQGNGNEATLDNIVLRTYVASSELGVGVGIVCALGLGRKDGSSKCSLEDVHTKDRDKLTRSQAIHEKIDYGRRLKRPS
ncbi:hypothetical protein Nepgr_013572 [Nepenthes gracilis]|uniref:Uncharacterized protein n=1 Tax=Nepenthes gracilis TaxID=150966 RepID=A0AAD3XPH0_NEPGR|nr:hypothetical protein Nepgr_013572 [Nepenthes gracilis]